MSSVKDQSNKHVSNAEQKQDTSIANDLSGLLQFPTVRQPPAKSIPQAIDASLPEINTPNETHLVFDDSDWEMFRKIHERYGDRLKVLYPDDTTRFVQGYAHEENRDIETFKRIDELLKRGFMHAAHPEQYDFCKLLLTPMAGNEEKESLSAWPVFMYGYDKEGHPIMYDEIGCSNPSDLDACFDAKFRKLKTFRFRVLRRLHNTKRIQSMRYGYDSSVNAEGGLNAITKHMIVMDLQNFHAKALTAKYRNLVRDIIGDESNLWPNTLEHMYIINAPWPFRFAWKIISNFVHPITVAKIDILGKDYLNTMKKRISLYQIPKKYGGKCELPIKRGYTADIDNDILDGDYCTVGDPMDLKTLPCIRNNNRLAEEKKEKEKETKEDAANDDDDDRKVDAKVSNANADKVQGNGSDDSYVKVQDNEKK
eukprot:228584_1